MDKIVVKVFTNHFAVNKTYYDSYIYQADFE